MTATRMSPVHAELEHAQPQWAEFNDMRVAVRCGDASAEGRRAQALALCDASGFARLTIKGRGAEAFLAEQGIAAPTEIFSVGTLPGGGLVARTGAAEFFCEDGVAGSTVAALLRGLGPGRGGAYRVVRQDASFILAGTAINQLMVQTCGVDFLTVGPGMVFSRVAAVSCSILKRSFNGIPAYQLWLDNSYASYLWETLSTIAAELGGGAVGLATFCPELGKTAAKASAS